MARDDLPLANDGNFDQVVPAGPVARLFTYVSETVGLLAGPALIVALDLVGELQWQGILGGVVVTVVVGGLSAASLVATVRMKRRTDRLARNGQPATAHVVDSRTVSIGEETGTELTLRISGPDVPEFETTHRGTDHRTGELGDEFPVVVDPSDNIFMILPRRSRA
ncbi:hypothetical protein [Promicromonospora sp. NPDC023805]|uniref:hypothetical protein n=1 Tax=Promicromonospora sp. NPDC023805 TaxID=3154696 RepID=UPI0033C67585